MVIRKFRYFYTGFFKPSGPTKPPPKEGLRVRVQIFKVITPYRSVGAIEHRNAKESLRKIKAAMFYSESLGWLVRRLAFWFLFYTSNRVSPLFPLVLTK